MKFLTVICLVASFSAQLCALENELILLQNELHTLATALAGQPDPEPKIKPKPLGITVGHKGLQVIGERTLTNGKKIIVGIGNVEMIEGVDAVMNAANTNLQFGSGVAGSIAQALGAQGVQAVYAEYKTNNVKLPVPVGSATPSKVPANTALGQRSFKYIIQAVGPDCRDAQQKNAWQTLLSHAYENSLKEASKLNLVSITIPPLSIGVFACDYKTALTIMTRSVVEFLLFNKTSLEEVILVVWQGGKNTEQTANQWLHEIDLAILTNA